MWLVGPNVWEIMVGIFQSQYNIWIAHEICYKLIESFFLYWTPVFFISVLKNPKTQNLHKLC